MTSTIYEKVILVQNVGNRPAKQCKLILESISIKGDDDYSASEVKINEVEISPPCSKPSIAILKPQGILSFPMFKILPEVGPHDAIPRRPMSFQIGDNKIEIKHTKTDYTIAFHIEAEDVQSSTQKMVVHWNGKWHGRKTEMKKVLSIEYAS